MTPARRPSGIAGLEDIPAPDGPAGPGDLPAPEDGSDDETEMSELMLRLPLPFTQPETINTDAGGTTSTPQSVGVGGATSQSMAATLPSEIEIEGASGPLHDPESQMSEDATDASLESSTY